MLAIKREDCEFLLSSTKFCNNIGRYFMLLDIDLTLLSQYLTTHQLLSSLLLGKYTGPAADYYISHKIREMKSVFNDLVDLCRWNENYTLSIGMELGIEEEMFGFSAN
ncbi:MAG: hypothetical protein JWO06_651 [Bacteroidota bacterium]|nr:hypothetical protein [Bacteroidota bacterium]